MASIYTYETDKNKKRFSDHLYNIGASEDSIHDAMEAASECGYLRAPSGSSDIEYFVIYMPSKHAAHIIGDLTPADDSSVVKGSSLKDIFAHTFKDTQVAFA